ncbi:MAG: glycoside hydrolase family 3 protein [Sphingomonadales bacterium]|nr:glycoside hydrolase family 3 protein [Sphingomonadales bacterium]
MKLQILSLLSIGLLFNSCAQAPQKKERKAAILQVQTTFELQDFLKENKDLDDAVEKVFASLDDTAIVAQLIMPAAGRLGQEKATIDQHIKDRIIGGVLMLNGTKDGFTTWINDFEAQNKKYGNLPCLYSADAEPSLVNRKIMGSTPVKKANEMQSIDEVRSCAQTISKDLNAIGINYNFSPVVDMSPNATVGFRSFGAVPANIIPWSGAFIEETQAQGIVATAKHFPGHGLVSGDTHKALQVIDGELKEIENYPPLIAQGVLSIMVAHIAVQNNPKYNTNGLPSTCSKKIVTDLLKNEMGYKGLIVTDAMNMGGVVAVPEAAYKAVAAGCDIVLMPLDAKKAHSEILNHYRKDAAFKAQVDAAAKKIIRMKIALGLLSAN